MYLTHGVYLPMSKVVKVAGRVASPPRAIGVGGVVGGFLVLIVLGTVLLSLPAARQPGARLDLMAALFTATSAVCVTGLVVVDTGTYWSPFGQGVILALIQLGGLGVMTASMLILIVLGRSISFRDRFEAYEVSKTWQIRSIPALILVILGVTLVVEAAGAAVLSYHLRGVSLNEGPVWSGIFHSVSAFNNAGFDIVGDSSSMARFVRDPASLVTLAVLTMAGGVGVLVLMDIATKRRWRRFSTATKLVLLTSFGLWAFGFLGVLAAEFYSPATLGPLSLPDKLANAFFQSVMPRTAGFSSLQVDHLQDQTQFLTMGLMYIGGATGSTAGGIKLNTLAVLALATWASVRGYDQTLAFGRRLSNRTVYRAVAVAALSMFGVFVATLVLVGTQAFAFRALLFEVVSALGTVGLSTGITPSLTVSGKLTLVVLMFVGRLGPLAIAYVLTRRAREPRYGLIEDDMPIG